MCIGYECMVTHSQQTGVGSAIHSLLDSLAPLSPQSQLYVFAQKKTVELWPTRNNTHYRYSSLSKKGRVGRILWQQIILPITLRYHSFDLYHATCYVASPKIPVPLVLSIYDTIALDRPDLTKKLNAIHFRWAIPASVARADRILVPSQYVAQRLIDLFPGSENKIVVAPLGVCSAFKPREESLSEENFHGNRLVLPSKYILFVGNLERKKNLTTLLKAFAVLKKELFPCPDLVFVGSPGNDYKKLTRLCHDLDVRKNVHFLGYVSNEELVRIYQGAEVFAFPALEEGFGFPPLEAMACGIPVIAAKSGAVPEVTGGVAALVDPYDVEEWAHGLHRLLVDQDERQSRIAKGLAWAAQFTWEKCAKTVLSVYKEAVEVGRGRTA